MKAGSATTSPKWRRQAKSGAILSHQRPNNSSGMHLRGKVVLTLAILGSPSSLLEHFTSKETTVTKAPYWNQSDCSVLVPYCCMTTAGHILTVWQLRRPGTLGKYCTALQPTASRVKNNKAVKNCKLFVWLTHVQGYTDIRKKYGTSWNLVTEWCEKPNPCCLGRSPVSFNVIDKFLCVFLTSSAKLHFRSIVI